MQANSRLTAGLALAESRQDPYASGVLNSVVVIVQRIAPLLDSRRFGLFKIHGGSRLLICQDLQYLRRANSSEAAAASCIDQLDRRPLAEGRSR